MMSPRTAEVLSQALAEIQELRTALERRRGTPGTEPIAVVGMGVRMPGAGGLAEFWRLLRDGEDATGDIPADRFEVDGYHDPDPAATGRIVTRRGAFLDSVDTFDAAFFGISPKEAAQMDPQQRLFLEVAWEALEHAGQPISSLSGSRTGVYLGITTADYGESVRQRGGAESLNAFSLTGGLSPAFGPGRLAHRLGLRGPAMSVDTACSSSLVAVHLAVQSLRAGECDMALAGGVNVLLSPEWFVILSKAGMLAEDGRCKTFDRGANGYARGEGCGVVVLKPLSAALAANDEVYAVLRGTAVNHDGRSSGVTVPNGDAQRAVVRDALRDAGLSGSDIGYVEAHGTGTALGDPIEVRALSDVLGEHRDPATPVVIGSVKTNIGHLEAAAGVAGFVKTVLALHHGEVPPLLHLTELNPEIGDGLPVTFPTELTAWPRGPRPRRAGVSSFGASGTNAHVVLEEAPVVERVADQRNLPQHLVCLSTRNGSALEELAGRYVEHLTSRPDQTTADIAFTATRGRAHLRHRLSVRARDVEELRTRLAAHTRGENDPAVRTGITSPVQPKVAFLFTGQGSQYAGMTRGLYDSHPGFRHDIDHCAQLLDRHLDRPLLSVLLAEGDQRELIHQTRYSQPALFTVQYALARLWRSWGIEPAAMLGHSVGEYAAACTAGVLDLEDALALVTERGRLMQQLRPGAMAAIDCEPDRVIRELAGQEHVLSVASFNGPRDVVVSGEQESLDELLDRLSAAGIRSTRLQVSHAFHSPMLDPVLDAFQERAEQVEFHAPSVPLVSCLTGAVIDDTTFSPSYLRAHAREAVRFMDGARTLAELGCTMFVEIGPSPVLCGLARRTVTDPAASWIASLDRGADEWTSMLDALGELYVNGAEVDWTEFHRGFAGRTVELPRYPFQRQRYWLDAAGGARTAAAPEPAAHQPRNNLPAGPPREFLRRMHSPLDVRQYQVDLSTDVHPEIDENVVDGIAIVNTGYLLESALRIGSEVLDGQVCSVHDLVLPAALTVPDDGQVITQAIVGPEEDGRVTFSLHRQHDGEAWSTHAAGTLRQNDGNATPPASEWVEEVRRRCHLTVSAAEFYRDLWRRRLHLGASARWLERVEHNSREALGTLRLPATAETGYYHLHPGVVDSALQVLFACVRGDLAPDELVINAGIERYRWCGGNEPARLCHARLRTTAFQGDDLIADITLYAENGTCVADMTGVHMRRINRRDLAQAVAAQPSAAVRVRSKRAAATRTSPSTAGELKDRLMDCIADVLGATTDSVDADEPLQQLGFNSLMVVELKNAIASELGVSLSTAVLLGNPSPADLVLRVSAGHEEPAGRLEEFTGPGGMHVVATGTGPSVVFVHGGVFPGADAWQAQLPLARNRRLIFPTRLNYGLSQSSPREDFEEDAKLIAELLGDGAHLVAQSYGTLGALFASAMRPEAVWSLTLVESAASGVARSRPAVLTHEHEMRELLTARTTDPESLFHEAMALIDPGVRFPSPLTPDMMRFARRMPEIRWPWEADVPVERLREAGVPSLVITGGRRPVFEEIGDALAEQLAGERLVLPGPHGTQNVGAAFNDSLTRFLSEVEGRR